MGFIMTAQREASVAVAHNTVGGSLPINAHAGQRVPVGVVDNPTHNLRRRGKTQSDYHGEQNDFIRFAQFLNYLPARS